MSMRITPDTNTPTASVELAITLPLPDYDLDEVEKSTPRQIDEILVSQGFRDLVDDARSALVSAAAESGLGIIQFTGAICPAEGIFRPGLWVVFQELRAEAGSAMSLAAQERVAQLANLLRARFGLSE
ncbi:MAG TPA: hypothetical protein VLW54_10260 [Candidatus Acidoferrales bacterium]|nr:hypothetical protein [Candidatus Acidoferrales bacterium]